MMRDEVCQEFGAWYRGEIPEEVHWRAAEAMADEIVRLRAIIAALREPSEAVVKAAASTYFTTESLQRAVAAAEEEVSA